MEDNNNNISTNNDNEESKKIVSNFKNELERLKQKLSKDFYKHSQIEKEKNESNSNFHYMNFNINNTNDKIEPNKNEILNTEPKANLDINKIGSYNIINQTEKESDKDEKATKSNTNTNTNTNVSIFTKVPSLEELKMKYGINLANKPSCIKEITIEANMSKFNNIKDIDFIKDYKDNKGEEDLFSVQKKNITDNNGISNLNREYTEEKNIDKNSMKNSVEDININMEKNVNSSNNLNNLNKLNINNDNNVPNNQYIFNSNKNIDDISNINNNNLNNNDISNIYKNDNDKFDYINLLNLKNNAEEEIKNILNRRDILDLSSNESDKENSNEEIKPNNLNNINNINNMNNIINNKEEENYHLENDNNNNNSNKINKKTIIKKDDEEDDEIEMINKYISDDKLSNNNFNNISIFKNNLNNNNNISCFSNISNINNNNQEFKQLMIDVTGKMDKKDDNKDLKEINLKKMINENNKNLVFKPNDNIFNLENESKSRLITNENPAGDIANNNNINNNNNNNINLNLDTSILNSKLDQQIKLINEKSEDNRIQEEKNQMKLKEIENSLQLDKRLTHDNREIRKNAIRELCEMCSSCDEEDKPKTFECFSPWVKYCLEETNSYVIPESLNFFILFNSLFPHFLSSSMKDFFDNIERYINFGISSINENCFKIVFLIFQDKKLFSQSLNEIIKLLNTRFTKMAKFLNGLLVTMIDNNIIPENYVKLLFEKLINVYIKMGTKITEKKQIYSKLLIYIYNNIEDDYNTSIKNNIKLKSYKETDALFNKIKKNKKQYKYRLYPKTEFNNNNEDNNDPQITNINKANNFNEKNISNKIPERRNNLNEKKEKDNLNNLIINNNGPDVNDILSVLPSEFFEYHFLTQFQTKIKLLEDTNSALSKIKNIKDKEKNLIDVYKTINYSIEDSNILIHLEGIKLLENICRLVKDFVNVQKLKLLLETCFDKLKDKKSLVKNELFTLFNMIIENHCFETDKFIIYILQFCSNQKKENAQVKMGLLEYIKLLFLQQNNVLCYEVKNLKEKDFYNFTKKVVAIIQKESLSSIKDLCSDLLIIFKKRVEDIDTFYDLISELPNYRKKIINEEAPGGMVEEGEYKKNLKRIKSSYSFSKTKYSGGFRGNNNNREIRHERNRSNYRVNNMERNNSSSKINNSFSSKNIKIKNNLNPKNNGNKSKYNTRTNFRSNNNNNNPKSQTGGLAKFSKKRIPSSSNIKNPVSYIKKNKENNKVNKNNISKNNKNYSSENSEEENENEYDHNNSNINDEDYYKEMNNDKNDIKNNNKDENFNKKKENLLDNINNLDINSIDKYSKIIIKDFLIFVKKICDDNSQKNEDLSYHFNIIFMIVEKIIYRFVELLEENQGQNNKCIKLKKSLDELIGYISKVVILTPCIHQIKGTKKFDNTLLETFLDKVKEFCLDKEKYYMHLLLSLYKFCEKDDEFPSELNAKPAVVYFMKYLKNGYLETKSQKLLTVLKEFISETKLLNLEEKKLLLISNNSNINVNDDDNEKNEGVNEEEKNININYNYKDSDNSDEEEKEKEIYNNKIKRDILNNNKNENENQIENNKDKVNNKNNIDNIMLRIKQFQDRLNNASKQENNLEVKTKPESEDPQINSLNNNKEIPSLKMDYSNNKNIFDEKEENYTNNVNNSKIKENDIQKIEESIRIMSKRLDKTLNKMNEASNRNTKSKGDIMTTNNSIKDLNNNSINVSKISEKNNYNDASIITSESYIKNNFISPNINSNPGISNTNKEIIEQLINVVRGKSNQNSIYENAKIHYQNLSSLEQKLDFIQNLRNYLDNPIFLSQIPIYTCTNLFDFILSILSYQILNQSNNGQIIASLQGIAEYLLPFRSLNDMFKIMMFLLKKYFPKNLNNNIEDISLIMIKVISYLLKELLKKMNRDNVIGKEIICEINDLFTITPPLTLTTAIPNARFYQTVFALLKSITDQIISNNKSELTNIIQYLQGNKIVCEEYIQYLIRLQNKI